MSTPFDPQQQLIVVQVHLVGPAGEIHANLALDTGASITVVRNALLIIIGYDLDALPHTVQMTTGSGVEFAPRVTVDSVEALEQVRANFPVVAHTLPPSASVDGVLGLDFFRDQELVVDFRNGLITLR